MAELPLVIVNVQRGGPSTGLPTKTEQSDLMQALYGRNGESPAVVLASSTPANCFEYAYMAAKIALEHMTPVILLSDGYLANGSQPWKLPEEGSLPTIKPRHIDTTIENWTPYMRDKETLARFWAVPGTEGFTHRIGGLEKDYDTGAVSHSPANHQRMTNVREEKVQRIANYLPDLEVHGTPEADLLVVGWGGTFGHLYSAVEALTKEGHKIAYTHINYIKPLPKNTDEIFSRYKKIVVCELNMGQLVGYLRMTLPNHQYLQHNKVQGLPFIVTELKDYFVSLLK